jgi:fructokinase
MPDIVSLGEALIDFIALESGVSLIEAAGFRKAPGGAPANVAAGAGKLGSTAAFVGKVGDDPFGRFLEQVFRENGVDTSRMLFDREARTGLAFVSLTAEHVPDFLFYRNPSADMLLTADELDREFIAGAKIFHHGSISLISEPSRSATEAATEIARGGGAVISYDPNLRLSLWKDEESAREGMIHGLFGSDIVKLSEEELVFITGVAGLSEGTWSLMRMAPSVRLVFVTRGGEGAFFAGRCASGHSAPFAVKPVDTTGAGDAFMGAALNQILRRGLGAADLDTLKAGDLEEICTFANAAGALATTKRGAITSLPTYQELQKFLTESTH